MHRCAAILSSILSWARAQLSSRRIRSEGGREVSSSIRYTSTPQFVVSSGGLGSQPGWRPTVAPSARSRLNDPRGSAMTANAGSGGPDGPRDRLASCLAAAWSFQILRRRPFSETGITSFSAPVIVAPTVLALRRWPFGFGQYPGLKRPVRRRADQGRMVSALYAGSAASELRASVSELGHCRQSQGHK